MSTSSSSSSEAGAIFLGEDDASYVVASRCMLLLRYLGDAATALVSIQKRPADESVAAEVVGVDDITGYGKISFSGQPFKIGDTNWITTMLQYRNPAGQTCGFVQTTDCILECRDDKSYATAPVRRTSVNASSDHQAFIRLHVPTDVYAKCFDPIIKVDSYAGIKQSVRDFESPAETIEYCVLSPIA